MVVGIARALDDVAAAYRSGGRVPYRRYGADFRHGQGGINRPAFRTDLTAAWLPAMPDVHDRLARPGARIADVGSEHGWSTLELAAGYPRAEVIGFDSDQASVDDARANAEEAGSTARFVAADATGLADHGPFDAVLLLECLHDMSRPVEVLYGWSVSHCLPVAMAEQPSVALGTVLRAGTVDELAQAAGFRGADVVDVDAGFFRIYRLDG